MIYLIDTIGTETGMHLYDEGFVKAYAAKGMEVLVLSNFSAPFCKKLFPNFYKGGKASKAFRFACALVSIFAFRLTRKGDYIYQSFGLRQIDRIVLGLLPAATTVVVHDLYEITGKEQDPCKESKDSFYRNRTGGIICHSLDVQSSLRDLGFKGNLEYVPHFSYTFDKTVDESRILPEISSAVSKGKKNFLFFGQIRKSKGILVLYEAACIIEKICPDFGEKANVIIAGMDKDGLLDGKSMPPFVKTILRYMDDNELNFFFSRCQVSLLPYEEIFQSGVLEVASYFGVPILASDLPFFRKVFEDNPSLGKLFSPNTAEALAEAMIDMIES